MSAVVDKIQSLYQGRPVNMQEMDCRVPMVFLDEYEEKEYWQPFGFSGSRQYHECPAYTMSTFTNLCKLCLVMNRILNRVYSEQSPNRGPEGLGEDLKSLHGELEQWYSALPVHLKFDTRGSVPVVPPPHVFSLL